MMRKSRLNYSEYTCDLDLYLKANSDKTEKDYEELQKLIINLNNTEMVDTDCNQINFEEYKKTYQRFYEFEHEILNAYIRDTQAKRSKRVIEDNISDLKKKLKIKYL